MQWVLSPGQPRKPRHGVVSARVAGSRLCSVDVDMCASLSILFTGYLLLPCLGDGEDKLLENGCCRLVKSPLFLLSLLENKELRVFCVHRYIFIYRYICSTVYRHRCTVVPWFMNVIPSTVLGKMAMIICVGKVATVVFVCQLRICKQKHL